VGCGGGVEEEAAAALPRPLVNLFVFIDGGWV